LTLADFRGEIKFWRRRLLRYENWQMPSRIYEDVLPTWDRVTRSQVDKTCS